MRLRAPWLLLVACSARPTATSVTVVPSVVASAPAASASNSASVVPSALAVASASVSASTSVKVPDSTRTTVLGPDVHTGKYRRVTIPSTHVSLELFDATYDVVHAERAGILLQRGPFDVELVVRAGEDEGLDAFRDEHKYDWTIGPLEKLTVCGKPAQRLRAQRPDIHITCVIDPVHGNHPAFIAATTAVAIVFEDHGLPVWLTWTVPTQDRATMASDEAHVIGSFKCE